MSFIRILRIILVFVVFTVMGMGNQCQSQGTMATSTIADTTAITFIDPVHHNIRMAGSFGEIRNNHFHGGIDIKSSKGEEGDPILASADGYVSRVKVQTGGYGKVLYIDHPNGFTSVYAHLQVFSDSIEKYIQSKQYETKNYELDIYLDHHKFSFDQGDTIGLMGNTGRSYGPHLHFEIRDTKTEIPENPYLHGIGASDEKAPLLYAVGLYGLDNAHRPIWSEVNPVTNQGKNDYGPDVTYEIPAWRAGLSIQTFDLMDGASNKNGIYDLKMYVDDTLYFHHTMDRVGFDKTKYINSHIDFREKKTANRTLIKTFVAPGNELEFYKHIVNRGEIKLYKSKTRKVVFRVSDYYGNISTYSCGLKRRDADKNEIAQKVFQKVVDHDTASTFSLGSCRFYFPPNSFDKQTFVKYEEGVEDGSFYIQVNDNGTPIFRYPVVSIPISGIDSALHSKVVLIHDKKTSYGGHVDRDSLRVRIGQLGRFTVEVDTTPPSIDVKSFLSAAQGKPFFRFEIRDNYEAKGFANDIKYNVYIDDQWVLAPFKALGNTLIVPLTEVPSGDHILTIVAEDHSGNTNTWTKGFSN